MSRAALLLCLLTVQWACAQQARFSVSPYDVKEGDAVVFTYLEEKSSVKYADIRAWRWDFDGDVTNAGDANDPGWDTPLQAVGVSGMTADRITTTWPQAVFSSTKGTGTALYRNYRPKLHLVKAEPDNATSVVPVDGITEPLGLAEVATPFYTVRRKGAEDDIFATLSFSASPRLANSETGGPQPKTEVVKFYAEVAFKPGVNAKLRETNTYEWDLDWDGDDDEEPGDTNFPFAPEAGKTTSEVEVPVAPAVPAGFFYADPGAGTRAKKSVALKVHYELTVGEETVPQSKIILKRDIVVVEHVPAALQMGRAYRQGFPEKYGWDDIIASYQAADGSGNRYSYFNWFEEAFFEQQNTLSASPLAPAPRKLMAETVNELLQGQALRGFQGMINALRMRYPRITGNEEPLDRLPPPAGAREESGALETAALDFSQAIQYAAWVVRAYGAAILRAGPEAGKLPPYPMFPNYIQFEDSTLSGAPMPVKNEYWQLATAVGGSGQARAEKAKLLWRLSAEDATALPEAKEECKVAATQNYLSMALLASGQTADQFVLNEGNELLATMRVVTDVFDKINDGVNPLGNDGSYIPNESFAAIYQDAQDAVEQAREAERNAREEKRLFDRNQADLRNELLAQRNQYITPLYLLTGLDPATYNNLATVGDQKDFKNAFYSRLNNLLANYPDADPAGLGEYGAQVAAILDAQLDVQDQITSLNNLYESIKISEWANAEIELINGQATSRLKANDIARGLANFISFGYSTGNGGSTSVNFSPGSIISGFLNADDRDITMLQNARISQTQLVAETRKALLQVANQTIAIRRAGNALTQARLKLDSMLAQMERLIVDLQHTRNTAADLYFQDPSFRIFASQSERRAAQELEYSVDRLYRLARTLQYEWTEKYQNPVVIPAASFEPPALESALFDKFTRQDSLFIVRSADEAKDFLDALKAWDSKLRRVTGVSVRGPNHTGPISAVPISLREHILGYKPNAATGYTLEQSIADFRNYLENARTANPWNTLNPSLEVHFPISIEDNTYFPATGSRWNMRLHSIAAEVYSESGFSDQQVAEIDLIQAGMVTLRTYWASPPEADLLLKMTHNVDNYDRTVFATAFPAKINGATGGRPLTEFDGLGLRGRPVAATDWILRINTENPANRNIRFEKIKDIVLKFTYTYGNPEEFPNF